MEGRERERVVGERGREEDKRDGGNGGNVCIIQTLKSNNPGSSPASLSLTSIDISSFQSQCPYLSTDLKFF